MFVVSRTALFLVAWLTAGLFDTDYEPIGDSFLSALLCHWDCYWYLQIAEQGYSTASAAPELTGMTNLAFFPVFPLLVAGVQQATGIDTHLAALLVANGCFLLALFYVYKYVMVLGHGRDVGLLSVALLCFVPQGYVFSVAYSESCFLLFLAAAMYYLRTGRPLLSGVAAACLSATRAVGIFFIVFALVHLGRQLGWRELLRPWRQPQRFIPLVLAPLGLVGFWWFSYLLSGDAFAQATSSRHGWSWQLAPFHENLVSHLAFPGESRIWMLGSLVVFALSLLLIRMRLYEDFVLCAAVFALVWSAQVPNALLRYSIVLFPVWIALAFHLRNRSVLAATVVAAFATLGGFMMVAWVLRLPLAI